MEHTVYQQQSLSCTCSVAYTDRTVSIDPHIGLSNYIYCTLTPPQTFTLWTYICIFSMYICFFFTMYIYVYLQFICTLTDNYLTIVWTYIYKPTVKYTSVCTHIHAKNTQTCIQEHTQTQFRHNYSLQIHNNEEHQQLRSVSSK